MMLTEVMVGALLTAFGVAILVVMHRNLRVLREMTAENALRGWDDLEPGRKQAIRQKLRRGEAVEDPHEAALALLLVDRTERVRQLMRPLAWITTPVLIVFLILGLRSSEWRFLAWIAGLTLALGVPFAPLSWFQRRRFRGAADATRKQLGED